MSSSTREGTVSTDFVMKKKRKRHSPVDPCLGFYSVSSSLEFRKPESPPGPLAQVEQNSGKPISEPPLGSTLGRARNVLHDGFASHDPAETLDSEFSTPSPFAHTSDPVPLPVELFLQRNARRIVRIKKYGRRNGRIIKSSSPSASNGGLRHHETDGRSLNRDALRDVLDNREGDEAPSKTPVKFFDLLSRPPLTFVTVKNQNTVRKKHRRRDIRPWSMVDPTRGVSFRGASFSKHDNKTNTSSDYCPLNKWKTLFDSVQKSQGGSVKKGPMTMFNTLAKKSMITRRQPLHFVPLADAEKAYATRFQLDNKAKSGTSPSAHGLRTTAPTSLLLTPTLASKKITPRSSRELSLSDTQSSQNDLFRPISSLELPPQTPVPSGSTSLARFHAEGRGSLPAEHPSNNSQPCSITVVHHEATMSEIESSSPGIRSSTAMCALTPKKPVKPLASFLDGFLERVRNATQLQAAITSLPDRGVVDDLPASSFSSGHQPGIQGTNITSRGSLPNSPVTGFKSPKNGTVQKSQCLPLHSRRSRTRPTKGVRNRGSPFRSNVNHVDSTMEIDCGVYGDSTCDYGLESDGIPLSDEPEFPPYRPPIAPFDIHAALQLLSQTEGQGIPLSIPSRHG